MAAMTFEELRDRVRELAGVRMPELWSDEQIERVVNEAYLRILSLADWLFLYSTETATLTGSSSAAAGEVPVPQGMAAVRSVALSSPQRWELRLRQLEDLDRQPEWQAKGLPYLWAPADDETVEVWPTPDEGESCELRLRCWKTAAPLDTGESPVFAEAFHPAVAFEAAARVLVEEGDDSGRSYQFRDEVAGYLLRMGQRYIVGDWEVPARVYRAQHSPVDDEQPVDGEVAG